MTNLSSLWWGMIYSTGVSRASKGTGCRVVEKSGRGAQLQHKTFQIRMAAERFWVSLTQKPRLEGCGLGRGLRSVGGHWEGAEAARWVRPFRGAGGDGRWEPSDSMDVFFSSLVEAVGEQLCLVSLI